MCLAVALGALALHHGLAAVGLDVPWLTLAVLLGIGLGQLPIARHARLAPGVGYSGKTLMRGGIVLLGLMISVQDLIGLGPLVAAAVIVVLLAAFACTWVLARVVGMRGDQPMLMAAGFSICGASAIGAVAQARGASQRDQAVPVALVTLCGTAAIAILPLAQAALGLDAASYGRWVGASVHDVGQVVATASIAGPAALTVAVVVKLLRVLCLAPMVALVGRRSADGTRPPIVPLFIVGFLVAVVLRSFLPLPGVVLDVAETAQQLLLATALVGLLSKVRIVDLIRQDWRGIIVAVAASAFIALAALGVVVLI